MCEPTTIALAGLALSAVGTGASVAGQLQQAGAQKSAANYQAQVAQNNAIAAQQNATAVENQAAARAQVDARAGAQRVGAQRAALAANGVTLDSGSGLDVQDATVSNTALTEQNTGYQGQLAAYGYQTQASNFTGQAALDTATGQNAASAGMTQAGGTLLSGASQVASKWNSYLTPPTTSTYGATGFGNSGGVSP